MDWWTTRRALIAGIVLAVVGTVVGWWIGASDVQTIERRLLDLCRLAEKRGDESLVEAARRADRIANLMTGDIVLISAQPWAVSLSSRAEVRRAVLEARAMLQRLDMSVDDVHTEVTPDRRTAEQRCTVRVRVDGGGWSDAQTREIALRWRRDPDGWRLASVEIVEVIRPLPVPNRAG